MQIGPVRAAFAPRIAVALAVSTLLAAVGPLAAGQQSELEAGAVAPEDCWYAQGGCAARTAATRTPVARGPLERAWDVTFKGAIEGEPLVWNETIVVCERTKDDRRTLHVLRLADGKRRMKKSFKTTLPLAASMWNRLIVVRSAENELHALTIGYTQLFPKWKTKVEGGPLDEPLLFRT